MVDRTGVIHSARKDLNQYKAQFVNDGGPRTLMEAMNGADVFVGLSGANLLPAEALAAMAPKPIVFACSNPILKSATSWPWPRDDLIMAMNSLDYPNQVNNVLGFRFIFRGTLDVRATRINER